MQFTKKLNKPLTIAENIIFVGAFGFIMYNLVTTYGRYIYASIKGNGYLGAVIHPLVTHQYYISIVSIIIILNTTFILWEIITLVIELVRQKGDIAERGYPRVKSIFKKVALHYKSSFLALLIYELLPKVILVHMFWIWLPHFQKFQLFTVNLKWYSWIYAYVIWELSGWLFHFSSHRVRVLWCFHSPHHAPSELNMSVNWVRFFAESYYSAIIFLSVLTIFGINPAMTMVIFSIDSAWGIFIHLSERTLKDGRLGFLQHLIITPAHHRVHHAKNPLYLDTNFASVLPIWDWMMGTLQPIKKEVRTEYGISRDLDVTNFSDLYFGELLLLYQDVKKARGIKNKFLYVFMPPGWTPVSADGTAAVLRREFLKVNPELGVTSKARIVKLIKSRFRGYKMTEAGEIPGPPVVEVK